MKKQGPLVKCLNCNEIHLQVSREYVLDWVERWKKFWPLLNDESKASFGLNSGPPEPEQYLKCKQCGGSYKNFIDIADNDLTSTNPTLADVLNRNETL